MTLSVAAAARELKCSRPTVYQMMADGRLPHVDGKPRANALAELAAPTVDVSSGYVDARTFAKWTGKHRDDVLRDYRASSVLVGNKRWWREDDAVSVAQELAEFEYGSDLFLDTLYDASKGLTYRRQIELLKGAPIPRVRRGNVWHYRECDHDTIVSWIATANETMTARDIASITGLGVGQVYWLLHCPSDKANRLPEPYKRIYRHPMQLERQAPYGVPVWRYNEVRTFLKKWDTEPIEIPDHLAHLDDDDPALLAWSPVHEIASKVFGPKTLATFLAVPDWLAGLGKPPPDALLGWPKVMGESRQQELDEQWAHRKAKPVPRKYL